MTVSFDERALTRIVLKVSAGVHIKLGSKAILATPGKDVRRTVFLLSQISQMMDVSLGPSAHAVLCAM